MFCGQCGKRVMENMLFCPFCGSPIVIPDQNEDMPAAAPEAQAAMPDGVIDAAPTEPAYISPETADAPMEPAYIPPETADAPPEISFDRQKTEDERPHSLFSDEFTAADQKSDVDPADTFVPLSFDFDAPAEQSEPRPEPKRAEPEIEDIPEETIAVRRSKPVIEDIPEEKPPMRRAANTVAPQKQQERSPNRTYIPPKDVNVDDLFMDEPDAYDDEYDLGEDYDSGFGGRSYKFVEEEEGSFFSRHVRGIVALILLAMVIVVLALWSFSNSGQTTLARMNLAWKASVYSSLADQAYKSGSKLEAAQFYEKAFARDQENYEYAHSSMVAYYESGEIERAAAMLKKCIAMRPNDVEPYQEMLVLYPDAASRPWEITEIVRDGYSRTGDERLNAE